MLVRVRNLLVDALNPSKDIVVAKARVPAILREAHIAESYGSAAMPS